MIAFFTSTLGRYALYIALAAGLLFGSLFYRSHVYDSGYTAGSGAALARATEARLLLARSDALATANADGKAKATLQSLKAEHDRVTHDLAASLAASNLRATRLDARIARLLNDAAGIRPGPSVDSIGTGSTPGTPEADYSVADLVQTANENYAICLRNSARLAGLQEWYGTLRSQK